MTVCICNYHMKKSLHFCIGNLKLRVDVGKNTAVVEID